MIILTPNTAYNVCLLWLYVWHDVAVLPKGIKICKHESTHSLHCPSLALCLLPQLWYDILDGIAIEINSSMTLLVGYVDMH